MEKNKVNKNRICIIGLILCSVLVLVLPIILRNLPFIVYDHEIVLIVLFLFVVAGVLTHILFKNSPTKITKTGNRSSNSSAKHNEIYVVEFLIAGTMISFLLPLQHSMAIFDFFMAIIFGIILYYLFFYPIWIFFFPPLPDFPNNKFFKKSKNVAQLYNKNVIVSYSNKTRTLTITNLLNNEQSFYMIDSHIVNGGNAYLQVQVEYTPIRIFRTIANYFNMNTTYQTLLSGFKAQGINIAINGNEYNEISEQKPSRTQKKLLIPIININNVSQEEITNLPGINIAQAKKAIKYREEHGGFKTKEEFYKAIKLKQHYIEIINKSIFVGKYDVLNEYKKEETENKPQEGRQIDF